MNEKQRKNDKIEEPRSSISYWIPKIYKNLHEKYKTEETELILKLNTLEINLKSKIITINEKEYQINNISNTVHGYNIKELAMFRVDLNDIFGKQTVKRWIRYLKDDDRWISGEEYIKIPLKEARRGSNFDPVNPYRKKLVELITLHGIEMMLSRSSKKYRKDLLYDFFKMIAIIKYVENKEQEERDYFQEETDDYYKYELMKKLRKCQFTTEKMVFLCIIGIGEIPLRLIHPQYKLLPTLKRIDFVIEFGIKPKLAIEVHSKEHFDSHQKMLDDYEKRYRIQRGEFILIEFSNKQFWEDPEKMIKDILKKITDFISTDEFQKLKESV